MLFSLPNLSQSMSKEKVFFPCVASMVPIFEHTAPLWTTTTDLGLGHGI